MNAKNNHGSTALHGGGPDVVALLVEAGADVNARTKNGFTPLHFARTAAEVNALLGAGADLLARDDRGLTPFLHAAENGQHLVLAPLVNAGADVNEVSDWGSSALHAALGFGPTHGPGHTVDHELLAILLSAGASVHGKNSTGETPLHKAAIFSTPDAVSVLLEAGADACAQDASDKTPLDRAVRLLQLSEEDQDRATDESYRSFYEYRVSHLEEIVSLLTTAVNRNTGSC